MIKAVVGIGVFVILFTLLPFNISMPKEIYDILMSSSVTDFMKTASYLFPIGFIFGVFMYGLSLKVAGIFISLISYLYDKIVG